MDNPFEKRATEYLRDDEGYLSLVSPEPLVAKLKHPAGKGTLFDRLVVISGTPGSGKTTLANLIQFRLVQTILNNDILDAYRPLIAALNECKIIDGRSPKIVCCRLPMEAEYRDYWELPYNDKLKYQLTLKLIQARAVLGWISNVINKGEYSLEHITFIPKRGEEGSIDFIGGQKGQDVYNKARQVEHAVYKVGTALIAPDVSNISKEVVESYKPFDIIEEIQAKDSRGNTVRLKPLVILDDAHILHADQLGQLKVDFARREIKIARWLMMRFDALAPVHAIELTTNSDDYSPNGIDADRETTSVSFQAVEERGSAKREFRKIAADISKRYLTRIPDFANRNHNNLNHLLLERIQPLAEGTITKLRDEVEKCSVSLGVPRSQIDQIRSGIQSFEQGYGGQDCTEELKLAMERVLIHRYQNKRPQRSFFENNEPEDVLEMKADSNIASAAKIYLAHKYNRPFFYGFNDLCDASSQNAELFLRLCSPLVSRCYTKLIQGRGSIALDAKVQDAMLREKAKTSIYQEWNFPNAKKVIQMGEAIAEICKNESLKDNAPLDAGANAISIPQEEFDKLLQTKSQIVDVLKYGVAYNALNITRNYSQGKPGQKWTLIGLGGFLILHNRLTLKLGGFVKKSVSNIEEMIK